MSVLTPADLQEHLGGVTDDGSFQRYIDQAEAAVAAEIGTPTIERDDSTPTQYVQAQQHTTLLICESFAGSLVGVIDANDAANVYTAVTSLKTPWVIELLDPADFSRFFGAGQVLQIDYLPGWVDGLDLPQNVRMAILNTAQWVRDRPAGGMLSERIGDYQYTLRQTPGTEKQTLPPLASTLLWDQRNPEFAR